MSHSLEVCLIITEPQLQSLKCIRNMLPYRRGLSADDDKALCRHSHVFTLSLSTNLGVHVMYAPAVLMKAVPH